VSAPRFLIDENLSVLLPETAHARGYEATHINHYGLRQSKDWDILKVIAEEDWILVTNNAFEFRGRYQKLEVHPGVVFLIPTVPRLQQIELFSAALDAISKSSDMVNTALDVTYAGDQIRVSRYALPE
jgi:predicted nuclease of predicted toxin-antitoxin system